MAQLFTSEAAARLLDIAVQESSTSPIVSIDILKRLCIPIFPEGISADLMLASAAEQQIRDAADKLASLRDTILLARTKRQFEEQMLDLKTPTEVLSRGLISSDDLEYKIRNFYPFPLAFAYRLPDSIVEPSELYKQQLRVAENILAFLPR